MAVDITAVICTLNRERYLRKALDSLLDQSLADECYEVLVVDNGSTDDTKCVVHERMAGATKVRYFRDPITGLSQARNTGWQQARGRYVAYLDDDAVAAPEWLECIVDFFSSMQPEPGCVGGKIEPIWETERPVWLDDRLLYAFAVIDWSETPLALGSEHWIGGGNSAYPRQLLHQIGGFPTFLGRRGKSLLSDEEYVVRQKLEGAGYTCYYHPRMLIRHHIPTERLSKAWLRRRSFWQGVSIGRRAVLFDSIGLGGRLQMAGRLSRRIFGTPWITANLLMFSDDPRRFALKCRTWNELGQILTLLSFRARRRPRNE